MIHYLDLPNVSDKAKNILDMHLNRMFMYVNSFMIAVPKGLVPRETLPPIFQNNEKIDDFTWAVPVALRNSKKLDKVIYDLVVKVFDEENFYEISIEEKYILAKVINLGIQEEERILISFSENNSKDSFREWMSHYRIENENDRLIVIEGLEDLEEETTEIEDYLADLGMKYRNQVVKAIGNRSLVPYEYPVALFSLFSQEEWKQIITMQDLEEIIKK